MLVVDDQGEQLGTMPTSEAIQLAQEKGVDLVEVAPAAKPPVCRLLDYGKFRYLQTKKEREARKGQKTSLLREVRVRLVSASTIWRPRSGRLKSCWMRAPRSS